MAGNGSSRVHRKETGFAGPNEPVDHAPISVLIQTPDLPRPGSLAAVSWPQVLEDHRKMAHMVKRMQKGEEEAYVNLASLVKSNQKERDEAYQGVLERMSKLEKDTERVRLQEIETCKKETDLQHKEAERLQWLEREETLTAIFEARLKKSVAHQVEKHKVEIGALQEDNKRVMEEFAEAKKSMDVLESQLAERTAREQEDAVVKGAMHAELESLKRAAEQERNTSEKELVEAKGALRAQLQLLESKLAATREEHAAEEKAILMRLHRAEAERDRLADCERHLLLIAEKKTKEHVEAMEGMSIRLKSLESQLAAEKDERISEAKRAVNALELQLADHTTKEKQFAEARNEFEARLAAMKAAESEAVEVASMYDLGILDMQSQLGEARKILQEAVKNCTAQFDDEQELRDAELAPRRIIDIILGRNLLGASGTNAASIPHMQSISDKSKNESMVQEQHSKKKRRRELCGVKERRAIRYS